MRASIQVTRVGLAPELVATRPVDLVAWERHTGRSVAAMGDGISYEDLCWLAWRASTRDPRPPFDAWLEQLDAVDLIGVEAPDPTQPGPGTG